MYLRELTGGGLTTGSGSLVVTVPSRLFGGAVIAPTTSAAVTVNIYDGATTGANLLTRYQASDGLTHHAPITMSSSVITATLAGAGGVATLFGWYLEKPAGRVSAST